MLFIDGVLPDGGTAEVIDAVRSLHSKTGVVVCSGYSEEALVQRGIDLAGCVRLVKPFARDELVTACSRALPR